MQKVSLNQATEEQQIRAVSDNPKLIKSIANPSDAVQIAAIKRGDQWVLQDILEKGIVPSDDVQLAAVKRYGERSLHSLFSKGIKPSDAVITAAVEQNGNAIEQVLAYRKKHNINVDDKLLLTALTSDVIYEPYHLADAIIKSGIPLSEEMQIKLIELEPFIIEEIPNPSENVSIAAVKIKPYVLNHIKNPSDAVNLAAVTQNPNVIGLIDNSKITPQIKTQVIKYILKLISLDHDVNDIMYVLRKKNLPWPEIAVIDRDLKVRRKISESRDALDTATEAEQIDIVKANPWKITYIENPSEAVQLAAISGSKSETFNIIEFLVRKGTTPSEKVQLASAAKNGSLTLHNLFISKIKPSNQVMLTALAQNGNAIADIFEKGERVGVDITDNLLLAALNGKDPDGTNEMVQAILDNVPESALSEQVQLALVNRSGYVLEYLQNPSLAVQLAAVKQEPRVIDCVDKSDITGEFKTAVLKGLLNYINAKDDVGVNRRRAVTLYFILKDRGINWPELDVIQKTLKHRKFINEDDINDISEEKLIELIKARPSLIKRLIDPSEAVQLAAVEAEPEMLEFIYNPTERVQLAAVSGFGDTIRFIDNPSEAVQLAAVKKSPYWALAAIAEKNIRPSEAVQLTAVKLDGAAVHWLIDNNITPSLDVQMAAALQSGYSIISVGSINPKILLNAQVKRNALKTLLMYIKDKDFYEAEQLHWFLRKHTNWPEIDVIDAHMIKRAK